MVEDFLRRIAEQNERIAASLETIVDRLEALDEINSRLQALEASLETNSSHALRIAETLESIESTSQAINGELQWTENTSTAGQVISGLESIENAIQTMET